MRKMPVIGQAMPAHNACFYKNFLKANPLTLTNFQAGRLLADLGRYTNLRRYNL